MTEPKLLTRLVLVRHGESEYNAWADRGSAGSSGLFDPDLTAKGVQQAERTGSYLREWFTLGERPGESSLSLRKIDAVLSSPLLRAKATADAIVTKLGGEVETVSCRDELRELSYGDWEGLSPSDPNVKALRSRWSAGELSASAPRGDSPLQIGNRARAVLRACCTGESPPATVLFVCHGRTLKILLASLLPGHTIEDMDRIEQVNGCVNQLTYDSESDSVVEVLEINAHAHQS